MRIAFAGSFAVQLAGRVWARLAHPCEVLVGDEEEVLCGMDAVEVLVSMAFTTARA